MLCRPDRLGHAAALGRILRDQPLQMRRIQPALKIQRQHLLQERLRERGRSARRRITQERPRPLLRQLIGQRDKLPCLLLRCQRHTGGKIIDGPGLRLP